MKWIAPFGNHEHTDRDCQGLMNSKDIEQVPDGTKPPCASCHESVANVLEKLHSGELGESLDELGFDDKIY